MGLFNLFKKSPPKPTPEKSVDDKKVAIEKMVEPSSSKPIDPTINDDTINTAPKVAPFNDETTAELTSVMEDKAEIQVFEVEASIKVHPMTD